MNKKNGKHGVRILAIILAVALALSLLMMPFASMAFGAETEKEDGITVLFTHDLHDHILPVSVTDAEGVTTSSGGYARLKTLLDRERAAHKTTITVDAGDFAMGSLFQSIYATDAPELRMLGLLGFDATTLGNHEYDYGPNQLAAMLTAARSSGDPVPPIVLCNYTQPDENYPAPAEGQPSMPEAFENYGVQPYLMAEKNGLKIALFGVMGYDADDCAPNSATVLEDPIEASKAVVKEIKETEDPDIIVCLSHSGTNKDEKKSEDLLLAKAVPDIDVIISGHTHTTLDEAIVEGHTHIVSAGSYCENLGSLTLVPDGDRWKMTDYTLFPVDDSIPEDAAVNETIDGFKKQVEASYLSDYGMTFDQVLARNDVLFTTSSQLDVSNDEIGLGNFLADSYLYAIPRHEGPDSAPITMAVVPSGCIRASFPKGELTTANAFDSLSLGIGADGTIGYPLVSVYLTGRELAAVAEIDASVSSLFTPAILNVGGVSYTYNPHRVPMDKVTEVVIRRSDGSTEEVVDDQLYRVVADLYSAQMFGAVHDMAYGLINLIPKDSEGNTITDFNDCILHDQDGTEIKAWQCAADYLMSFEQDADGVSCVPAKYAAPDGRKVVDDRTGPAAILSHPGTTTKIAIAAGVFFVLAAALITFFVVRRFRRRRKP